MSPGRFIFVFSIVSGIAGITAELPPAPAPAQPRPGAASQPAPAAPTPKSPVAYFRELLAMKAPERETALGGRSAEAKAIVLAKLAEYEALAPAEREVRLHLMELRWHLAPLMHLSSAARAPRLSLVPAEDRKLIEDRLRQWDQIAPELQKEFLEHEATVHYFLRLESSTPSQQASFLQSFPAPSRERLEKELAAWRALPAEKRERICERFHQFFELDDRQREKTLNAVTEAERQQMERALQAFQDLPSDQRKQYIAAFRKFAAMTPAERNEFMRNAERWQKMSPPDRQFWRELVQKAAPVPPLPPLPPASPPLLATNAP